MGQCWKWDNKVDMLRVDGVYKGSMPFWLQLIMDDLQLSKLYMYISLLLLRGS